MSRPRLLLVVLLAACLAAPGLSAGAEEEVWPSEVKDRLTEVESKVLDVQRKRAVARLNHDQEKLQKLEKEFKELQDERIQLLRDDGQLQ